MSTAAELCQRAARLQAGVPGLVQRLVGLDAQHESAAGAAAGCTRRACAGAGFCAGSRTPAAEAQASSGLAELRAAAERLQCSAQKETAPEARQRLREAVDQLASATDQLQQAVDAHERKKAARQRSEQERRDLLATTFKPNVRLPEPGRAACLTRRGRACSPITLR